MEIEILMDYRVNAKHAFCHHLKKMFMIFILKLININFLQKGDMTTKLKIKVIYFNL